MHVARPPSRLLRRSSSSAVKADVGDRLLFDSYGMLLASAIDAIMFVAKCLSLEFLRFREQAGEVAVGDGDVVTSYKRPIIANRSAVIVEIE